MRKVRNYNVYKRVVMWKALIKLVEKWACKHEWHLRTESYENFHTRQVWICWKCGKIKKIKL